MTRGRDKYAPHGNHPGTKSARESTCEKFEATRGLKRFTRVWTTPVMLVLLSGPHRFAELARIFWRQYLQKCWRRD